MIALPQDLDVNHIEFPAGTIRFHRAGSAGQAVVLLHGGGLDNGLLSWRYTIPVLAADHQVYVPDLPGQGGSIPWRGRANQRTCEETLRWLLDRWGLQDVIVVGLGTGGSVAAGFTLRHPQRVRGLVLVNAEGMRPRLERHLIHYLLLRVPAVGVAIARTLGLNRSLVHRLVTRSAFSGVEPIPDLESIVNAVRQEIRSRGTVFTDWQRDSMDQRAMRVNHLPHLDRIHCPTMVIHGEQDRVVPVTSSRAAASAIQGATLRIVPDTGHWLPLEKPNEFNALIREFVNAN